MSSQASPEKHNPDSPTAKIHTRPWAATLILTGEFCYSLWVWRCPFLLALLILSLV